LEAIPVNTKISPSYKQHHKYLPEQNHIYTRVEGACGIKFP